MILFNAPKDYPEMLNKIASWNFLGSLVLVWLVAATNPSVGTLLLANKVKVNVLGATVPLLVAVPALVIAVLFRIIKFHDRVSDLLRIREDFDMHEILTPLAGGVGIGVSLSHLKSFRADRDRLMNKVFYHYAGSSNPRIGGHYVAMALDCWSWFWIIIELEGVALLTAFLLVRSDAFPWSTMVLGAMWLGLFGGYFLRRECADRAHTEVELILDDAIRRNEIRAAFNALQDRR